MRGSRTPDKLYSVIIKLMPETEMVKINRAVKYSQQSLQQPRNRRLKSLDNARNRSSEGIKAAPVVKRHGIRLLPGLYAHLNPMPFEAAARMEKDLSEDLRRAGFTVTGGH